MRLADGTEVQLVVDTWEGSLDIDEQELLSAGVVGIIPRLNAISGDLRRDREFDRQWAQAAVFPVRFPYPVHSPWKTAKDNFNFWKDNVPTEVRTIMPDVELQDPAKTPQQEGVLLRDTIEMANDKWNIAIYTGQWFANQIVPWPNTNYIWARYPYSLYPASSMITSWDYVKTQISKLTWNPTGGYKAPGTVIGWQCTADRYKLPGCAGRAIDIVLLKGSLPQVITWVNEGNKPPTPEPLTLESLDRRVRILESKVP